MVVLPEHFLSALELLWESLAGFQSEKYLTEEYLQYVTSESSNKYDSSALDTLMVRFQLSKLNHPFSNTGIVNLNLRMP